MWKSAEYASTGRGHLKAGIPCQDKVRTYRKGEVTVITLADGAGSAKLSHFGAEAVLHCVSKELGEHFEAYYKESNSSVVRRMLYSKVLDTLGRTQSELHCELRDLSSTLLAVAVSGSRYFMVHLGDGVIGYLKDDEIKVATCPDNGDYANETYFTTSPSAMSRMRIIKGSDDGIHGFVLMSDGTENALYNKRTGELSQGIKRIMHMTVLCPERSMQCLLSETLKTVVMNYTQDDCSISVLTDMTAFPDFKSMPFSEQLNLLQISCNARDKARRVRQTTEILQASSDGASVIQIASQIHVKPKHVRRKLDSLTSLGLLERNRGIYYSA